MTVAELIVELSKYDADREVRFLHVDDPGPPRFIVGVEEREGFVTIW